MHKWPHLDEVLAYYLVLFSGLFRKVTVLFLDFHTQDNNFTNMDSVLPIGIGQGRFDEHRSLDFSDRIPNECAATLVAKDLEISMTDALQRLLEYTLEHDSKGTRTNLDLADFMNCLNKFFKDSHKTLELGKEICEALCETTYSLTQFERDEVISIIDEFLMENKNENIAGPILKFAKGLRNGNKSSYELTEIYVALRNKDQERAKEVTRILLRAKYHIQELFQQALRELDPVKETNNFIELKDGKVEFLKNGIKLLTIESTNTEISKAARYRRADVIIHKNEDDVFISSNKKSTNLTGIIDNIAAALRLEEQCVARGRMSITSLKTLSQPGDLKIFSSPWYFQTEDRGGKIMAKKDEKTKIPLQRISQIVKTILLLEQNFKWEVWKRKAINGNRYRARQNRV